MRSLSIESDNSSNSIAFFEHFARGCCANISAKISLPSTTFETYQRLRILTWWDIVYCIYACGQLLTVTFLAWLVSHCAVATLRHLDAG